MDLSSIPMANFKMPDYTKLLKNIDYPEQHMFSDTQFEIIKKYIQDFENNLDSEHNVGVILTNFGQSVTMIVDKITYEKSVILVFKGWVNGNYSTLIQHINQLNFLLTAMPIEPEQPKRKIGFSVPEK